MNKISRFFAQIGFRSISLEQELEFDPDPIEKKEAGIQSWLLNSLDVCIKGIAGYKLSNNAAHLKQNFLSRMHEYSSSDQI